MQLKDILDTKTKILIADDIPSARLTLRSHLKSLGYENIVEAENGKRIIELLEENPDTGLIISDWNMPEMDGMEAVRAIQGDERFCNIPLIMATTKSETEDIVEAAVSGVWGYITKPVTKKLLEEEILGALSDGREGE